MAMKRPNVNFIVDFLGFAGGATPLTLEPLPRGFSRRIDGTHDAN